MSNKSLVTCEPKEMVFEKSCLKHFLSKPISYDFISGIETIHCVRNIKTRRVSETLYVELILE